MFEYGRGVGEGAGWVPGSGGGGPGGSGGVLGGSGGGDWGAQIGRFASDAVDQVMALPPTTLLLVVVGIVIAFMILRRAF